MGAVATTLMPKMLSNALGIALYGMFIAIIIPPARKERNVMITILLAVLASLAFAYLPVIRNLSSGWAIIIITLLVSAIAATLFPKEVEVES